MGKKGKVGYGNDDNSIFGQFKTEPCIWRTGNWGIKICLRKEELKITMIKQD